MASPAIRFRTLAALALLSLYFLLEYVFEAQLLQISEYATYIFEAAFCFGVGVWYGRRDLVQIRAYQPLGIEACLLFLCGWAIYKLAAPLGLMIPFDLSSKEMILFLLLIGPVLEELVFRFALWELIKAIIASPIAVWLGTSVVFSFAHFRAWWSTPAEIHSFIIYQTAYTLALGLYLGHRRLRTGSMASPVLGHLFFNLGFYCGSLG